MSPDERPTLFFVIPLFNEEKNIQAVIDQVALKQWGCNWHVIAVDDGSRDRSAEILRNSQSTYPNRIHIFRHPENLGVQNALETGLCEALRLSDNRSRIFVLEGDGTSDLELCVPMLNRLDEGGDIVIASRFMPLGGWIGFPLHRRWISGFGNWILRKFCPYPGLSDYSIFFRGYRASFLQRVFDKYGPSALFIKGFVANTSLLLHALAEEPSICQVANRYHYNLKQSTSSFRILREFAAYARMLGSIDAFGLRQVCLSTQDTLQEIPPGPGHPH